MVEECGDGRGYVGGVWVWGMLGAIFLYVLESFGCATRGWGGRIVRALLSYGVW